MQNLPDSFTDDGDNYFDPGQIFIGREQQMDLFNIYLTRWKNLMHRTKPDDTPVTDAPSPNNKIAGLVVLLFGRGGFGKSTLLKHYRKMALEEHLNALSGKLAISEIRDWEFAVEGKRAIFNPPPGQDVDANEYYKILCAQLAIALDKEVKDFKEYHSAVQAVEKARKDVSNALNSIQKDDRFPRLRGLALETVSAAVRTYVPGSSVVVDNKKVQEAADAAVKLTGEQIAQVHAHLRDRLGSRFGDYLDSTLRLGLALGRDLRNFARNYPLLIFFDTYEEIDEGDRLLRIVMKAAGLRVGWVLAGRDNLWAGPDQIDRSIALEYGYKELMERDRGLSINFNAGDVGAFTPSDIIEYFTLLRRQVQSTYSLPEITEEGAKSIFDVTQGVPLAVKIAANLYLETEDLNPITEMIEGQRAIVDQMVRRYLLHTHADQSERARLYGLAMLRRADQPIAVAAALGLTPEEARTSYRSELSRLHRRYSFIFTEKQQPSLHQEVRRFLRLWLLERRKEPEIVAVNERLKAAQESAFTKLEELRIYSTLEERFQDERWTGLYLDLMEQQFWLDPDEGMRYLLPFIIAASIYQRATNKDAFELAEFFEKCLSSQHLVWWQWTDSLVYTTNIKYIIFGKEPADLQALAKLVQQRSLTFPNLSQDYHQELEAALWWRLGETYAYKEKLIALEWYEKALTRLGQSTELKKETAKVAFDIAYQLDAEKKYAEAIVHLNRSIELDPSSALAYTNRGNAYADLKEFKQAFADYNRALELDPSYALVYANRGITYYELKEFKLAIVDCSRALELNPFDSNAYSSRGNAYHELKESERAIADYTRALELNPSDADTYFNRGNTYCDLKEFELAIADYTRALEPNPSDAEACNKRGLAYHELKEFELAIADYTRALEPDSSYIDAYINRGNTYTDLKEFELALADYTRALELNSSDALAYFNRGRVRYFLKEFELAFADHTRALELNSSDALAYQGRGLIHLCLKKVSQAGNDYKRSLELDPANVNTAWMIEWVEMIRQRADEKTAERLEAIATMDLKHYAAHVCRGVALGLRGKGKEGLEDLEKAIPLEPTEWDAYFWKGMLLLYYYRKAAQDREAIAAIERALDESLPPVLLTPLYWFERDRPDVFAREIRPLLARYGV